MALSTSSPLSLPPKLSEVLRDPTTEEDEMTADAVVIPATTPLLPVALVRAASSTTPSSPSPSSASGVQAGASALALRTSLGKSHSHAGRRTPSVEHLQLPRWLYVTLLVPLLLSLSIGAFFILSTHVWPHQSVCSCFVLSYFVFWRLIALLSSSSPPIRTPHASSPRRPRTVVPNQAVASPRIMPPASWCELCLPLAQREAPCSMRASDRSSYQARARLRYAIQVLVVELRERKT
jgi:hypothetical protein